MTETRVSRRNLLRGAAALAGAGALGALAACSGPSPSSPSNTSSASGGTGTTAAGTGTSPAVGASSSATTTLTQFNASNGLKPVLLGLNEEYKKQKGVTIDVTTNGSTYDQAFHALAQSGKMPDIYYPTGEATQGLFAPYVQAGWALDLTDELNAGWKSSFKPNLLAFGTYTDNNVFGVKPGTYFVPFDGNCWMFYALPDAWKKADLDPTNPPTTFDDLISDLKKISKTTPQAFEIALSQSYVTDAFLQTYANAVMSTDEIVATCQGKAPWSSSSWKTVIELFSQIRDAGILAPGAINAQMPDLEKAFFSQRALACFWGFTIDLPVGQVLAPNWDSFNNFKAPPLTAGHAMKIAGSQGKCMAINAKSPNTAAALEYLKWFTAVPQQTQYAKELPGIPANPGVTEAHLDSRIVPFSKALTSINPPTVAWTAPVSTALNKGIQQLMNKEADASAVLAAADAAQKQGS